MGTFYKLSIIVISAVSLMIFNPAKVSQAASYSAVQSGDWNDSATWGGTVPSSTDHVTIPNGITVTITSGDTIERDGMTTVNGGGTLINNGTLTNSNNFTNLSLFTN